MKIMQVKNSKFEDKMATRYFRIDFSDSFIWDIMTMDEAFIFSLWLSLFIAWIRLLMIMWHTTGAYNHGMCWSNLTETMNDYLHMPSPQLCSINWLQKPIVGSKIKLRHIKRVFSH